MKYHFNFLKIEFHLLLRSTIHVLQIPPTLRRDVERFSIFVNRLRSALDSSATAPGIFLVDFCGRPRKTKKPLRVEPIDGHDWIVPQIRGILTPSGRFSDDYRSRKKKLSDGVESACVSVHAALEMVSESVRDLLKHQQFKTNFVILPSLQLVQCVKGLFIKFCWLYKK